MYNNNVIFKKNKFFSRTMQFNKMNQTKINQTKINETKINKVRIYDSGSFDRILQEEIDLKNSK